MQMQMQAAVPATVSGRHGLASIVGSGHRRQLSRGRVAASATNGDKNDDRNLFQRFFDFSGDWAPKSTRVWRLQQYEYNDTPTEDEAAVDELEARVNRLPPSSRPSLDEEDDGTGPDLPLSRPFSEAGDREMASALSRRISELTNGPSGAAGEAMQQEGSAVGAQGVTQQQTEEDEEDNVPPLTGQEIRDLIYTKYGKTYDVSIVRRDMPGKTFVALNIMWVHLEQRSFRAKMSEAQYMDKLDSIAYLLHALGQTAKVRSALQQPARSVKGLPARPVVGIAISIQLELEQNVIDEFFSQGYN